MCARPSFISLACSPGAEGFKGSAPRRGHMAIYPRCGFQGTKEYQGLASPLAEGAKIPAWQMSTKKDYLSMEAGLTLPAWVGAEWVEMGGCCGGIPNEQEAPQDSSCPRSPTGRRRDQRRRPRFTKAVPLLPHTRSGIELLQTAHDKQD